MKRLRHSKLRNTGILYELLMRQVSADVVAGNMDSKALTIVKEYFVGPTEIKKELELYQMLVNRRVTSETKAGHLLDAVLTARCRLNNIKLRRAKYNIIKEISHAYNVETFFGSNVPNYTQYASVYKLFEHQLSTEPSDPEDVTRCKTTLVEHICGHSTSVVTAKTAMLTEFEREPEDVRLLTTKILVDKFNAKYHHLSFKQKSLLREYIEDTQGSLKRYIETELPRIRKELVALSPVVSDKVVRIKLNEVVNQLSRLSVKGRDVKDNNVVALLGYYALLEELTKLKKGE